MKHVTSEQMRALEKAAIESGRVSGSALMERAGHCLVDAALAQWPALRRPGRAIILCGPGNNGGDGFVMARLLMERGWDVNVFFYGDVERLPPDARANHDRWLALEGARVQPLSFPVPRAEEVRGFADAAYGEPVADLVVDALFGIGLARPIVGLAEIVALNAAHFARPGPDRRPHHLSVDVPSGLADEGPLREAPDLVLRADLTVTFHCAKTAHENGAAWCGDVVICDIGLPELQ